MKLFFLAILSISTSLFSQNESIGNRPSTIDQGPFYIVLQFDKTLNLTVTNGKMDSTTISGPIPGELEELNNQYEFEHVIPFSKNELIEIKEGQLKEIGFSKKTFSSLVKLIGTEGLSKDQLVQLADDLEKHPFIEYATIKSEAINLPPSNSSFPPVIVEDYSPLQSYLWGDLGEDTIGVFAEYAWDLGITGQGVKIVDIEYGWYFTHGEFVDRNVINLTPEASLRSQSHGTAVVGIMYGKDDGQGVTGIAHGADSMLCVAETIEGGRVAAIALAAENLEPGDVIVYEMQSFNTPGGAYAPADYDIDVWNITKEITAAGIIVVAAAGNGAADLDYFVHDSYNARGDNGSIIVGGGTRVGRNKTGSSTFGSRVNVHAYGTGVFTSRASEWAYNPEAPADFQYGLFGGTSSATPIVAGAVTLIQSFAKNKLNITLTPSEMRNLIVETGTPQGNGGLIGPLPNVQAAIEKLSEDYVTSLNNTNFQDLNFDFSNVSNKEITISVNESGNYLMSIYTIDGREIFSEYLQMNKGKNQFGIHFLSVGSYVVKFGEKENTIGKTFSLK